MASAGNPSELMCKIAEVPKSNRADAAVRVMIYELQDWSSATYVFLYDTLVDGPGTAYYWFETEIDAEKACAEWFGIGPLDWAIY